MELPRREPRKINGGKTMKYWVTVDGETVAKFKLKTDAEIFAEAIATLDNGYTITLESAQTTEVIYA
jgi:hypothetical protein